MSIKISRRTWGQLSLSGLVGFLLPSSLSSFKLPSPVSDQLKSSAGDDSAILSNVIIGVQTYSFRDRELADAIKEMNGLGIKSCELWQGHVEPLEFMWKRDATPEENRKKAEGLKNWRSTTTMDDIKSIRDKINKGGINIQAYNGSFGNKDTDEDFDLVFRIARALGTDTITTSATVGVMKRVDALAQNIK